MVGGGNSAGQAIAYLAGHASRVHVILRGQDLGARMSRYLVNRIEGAENVTIHRGTTISKLEGDGHLSAVELKGGEVDRIETKSLFLFIGADPNTDWLDGCVELDPKKFVLTGNGLPGSSLESERWRSRRTCSVSARDQSSGCVRCGDVRFGSAKRVSAAVGEGAMAVSFVHAHIGSPV